MSSLRELVFYQSSQREYLDFGQNQLFCNSLICYAMHFYPSYLCNNYLHRIALDLSSMNLLIMFPNFALCLSVTPFDLGDLPAVDLINVFRWSDISLSNLLVNSSPLSDKIWVGAPNKATHCWSIAQTISLLHFDFTMAAVLLNCVAWTIISKILRPWASFRSIVNRSLRSFNRKNPAIVSRDAFLCFI